jgi:glycerol-3-phosphate dehydrogenase subunit C
MNAETEAGTDLVAGDCHLANTAIDEATGKRPVHPVQVLARAYGLEGA